VEYDEPLFYDKNGYALLSTCAATTLAFAQARPGDSGVRRADHQQLPPVGAGYEAPINLCTRSGIGRHAFASRRTPTAQARRLEFRAPDPSCNPYLAFSAMLMPAWMA